MPATKAELRKVRQELIDKTPLIYQGEIFDNWSYVIGEKNLQEPNTATDFKIVLIKEAINIWDNKTYNLGNIKKIFKPNIDVGNWEVLLKAWLDLKNTLKLPDWNIKGYIERRRGMPDIFKDFTDELAELDNAKVFSDKYEALYNYWKTDFKTDFDNHILDVDGLKLVKGKLTQLTNNQEKHTDYDTIKKERDNWVAIFPSPLTPDLVKVEYDKPKEIHTDYDQIKIDLDKWAVVFPNWTKDPEIIKNWWSKIKAEWDADFEKTYDNFTDENLKRVKVDLDKLKNWTDTFGADKIPIDLKTSLDQQIINLTTERDKEKKAKETAEKDLNDFSKAAGEKAGKDNIKIGELEKEIKTLKDQQATQENQENSKLFFISRKLLSIYVEEIKKRTELFYQELSIDNNKVNEKYGDKNRSYLLLLHNLTPDSKPEQVINAFRIVALIIATERSQSESDELIKLPRIPVALKNNKLKYFQKVKDGWDLLNGEIQETNNPLYLPIIKDQAKYRTQINEIITLWQAK